MIETASDPVPIANLLRIAFYAGNLLEELEQCESGHAEGCHFVELLGGMLGNAALRIRRNGFLRGYQEQHDCSSQPRGRVDIASSIASLALARGRLEHTHDEFKEDAPDNRVLKSAITTLLAEPRRRHLLPETCAALELVRADLREVRDMRLDSRLLASTPHGPGGRRYRTVRFVARILATEAQPDAEQVDDWALRFVQDARRMRAVFERFVRRFARNHAPDGTRVHRPRFAWDPEIATAHDPRVPILEPDVVLRQATSSRIVECKYTPRLLVRSPHDGDARFQSAHLQQLFAYLSAEARRGLPVSGLLLYPRVGQAVRTEVLLDRYPVTVATLDLAKGWNDLIADLGLLLMQPDYSSSPRPPGWHTEPGPSRSPGS